MDMLRISVEGVVQGVGFRPFIYRKAGEAGAKGTVKNTGSGVEIITDRDFVSQIKDWPTLARVDSIEKQEVKDLETDTFSILRSDTVHGDALLPPDLFICNDCLRELWDRDDRRHGYYFTTCTNCGPRFSMIEETPYDRPNTSMADFSMCERCRKEYDDPSDRRYHAQTIACPDCGPRLKLISKGSVVEAPDIIKEAVKMLKKGRIIGIKGVGGFHLACIARKDVVGDLRIMLERPYKPFALMVKGVKMARQLAHVDEAEERLLKSYQRPIVVLRKKKPRLGFVSELDSLGMMLPYTALHYLLFNHLKQPLVMTSANMPGEPIMVDLDLGDDFLTHERRIVNRCDDSVVKAIGDTNVFIRKSRGYVPLPVYVKGDIVPCLALGAEMHNACAAAQGGKVYLSQYIGNTGKDKTLGFCKDAVRKLLRLSCVKPKGVLCDLHPDFNTTHLAGELARESGAEVIRVQHHVAHLAGAGLEHGLEEFVGIACDGIGYGEDGNIWGGEVIRFSKGGYKRVGHLQYQPMLGGDSATLDPKKMLFGILSGFLGLQELIRMRLFAEQESRLLYKALKEGFNVSYTSSTGRVLDACAALLRLVDYATYEGRPAMMLESVATEPVRLEPVISQEGGIKVLDTMHLFRKLLAMKQSKGEIAATCHNYLIEGLYRIAEAEKLPIVFSGGVGYNRLFTGELSRRGVLMHREVPCGDGGIAFGQVAYGHLSGLCKSIHPD